MLKSNEFSNRAQMGPEMMGILTAVTHFGCLTREQAMLFMPETKSDRERKFNAVVSSLAYTGKIKKDERFLLSMTQEMGDPIIVDAAWVFLEIVNKLGIKDENGSISKSLESALDNSLVGAPFEIINFILDGQRDIHIIPLYRENDLTSASFLENKYLANHPAGSTDSKSLYMFVFRNPDLFNQLKMLNLKLPFGVAYLKGEAYLKPEIQLRIASKK